MENMQLSVLLIVGVIDSGVKVWLLDSLLESISKDLIVSDHRNSHTKQIKLFYLQDVLPKM